MSKINAIRLVNLNYNYNTIHVGDETLYMNGENTLIHLENGSGKTVMVQMLISLFVHKRFRKIKNREFSSYFTGTTPTHVMVEWALDNGAGYVLTGMMVRRNPRMDENNSEELEIYTYVSEYRSPCPHDMAHLPVVDRSRPGIHVCSVQSVLSSFEAFKKDRGIQFKFYDLGNPAQLREYMVKLGEYGISNKEWQSIIRKVNEEESGLSKLFEDCRDEKALVTGWFLPAIEDKLNRRDDRMKGFQNTLESLIIQIRNNQDKLQEWDAHELFQTQGAPLLETATAYEAASEAVQQALYRIAAYREALTALQGTLEEEHVLQKERAAQLEDQLARVELEQRSAAWYRERDALANLREQLAVLDERRKSAEESLKKVQRELDILDCARLQETVDGDRQALLRIEQELEVCQQEEAELKPELEYLGYRLRVETEGQLAAVNAQRTETLSERSAAEMERVAAKDREDSLTQQVQELSREQGRLEADVAAYSQTEEQYCRKWRVQLARNLMGEYDPGILDGMKAELLSDREKGQARLQAIRRETTENLRKSEECKKEIQEQDRRAREAEQRLWEAKAAFEKQEAELQERRIFLQYLDLREETVYDLPLIRETCARQTSELDARIREQTTDVARLADRIQRLESGRNLPLGEAQRRQFRELDIPLVYGMEWLRRNRLPEEENRQLVEKQPLLPYALVLSETEWEKLRKSESKAFTDIPVPVVLREALKDGAEAADMEAVSGVRFYTLFNSELLNEDRRQEMLEDMQREQERQDGELSRYKEAHEASVVRQAKLAEHTVTAEMREKVERENADCESEKNAAEREGTALREEVEALEAANRALREENDALEKSLSRLQVQIEAFEALEAKYQEYVDKAGKLHTATERLAECTRQKQTAKAQLEKIQRKLSGLQERLSELQVRIAEAEREALQYGSYGEAKAPDSLSEELRSDMAAIRARFEAIQKSVSGQMQHLEEARKDAFARLQSSQGNLERTAGKHGLQAADWEGVLYSPAQEAYKEMERKEADRTLDGLMREAQDLEKKEARIDERANGILAALRKECRVEEPLPREEISELDYEARKTEIRLESRMVQEKVKSIADRIQMVGANRTALVRFKEAEVSETLVWEEDLSGLDPDGMRTVTGRVLSAHDEAEEKERSQQRQLMGQMSQMMREELLQGGAFREMLGTLQTLTGEAGRFRRQLEMLLKASQNRMGALRVDLQVLDEEKTSFNNVLLEYVRETHEQMGCIDRKSTINVKNRNVQMLKLSMPEWEANRHLYASKLSSFVNGLISMGLEIADNAEAIHDALGKQFTCQLLYDAVIGLENIHVELIKIEREQVRQISWENALRNSGGEGFLSSFVILACLLDYMRYDETDMFSEHNEGKVLIMDNPFAQTNAEHLLRPLTDLSKKTNTQLICFTGLHGESIVNQFDNIYVLDLVPSSLGNGRYMRSEHRAGREPDSFDVTHMDVHGAGEQLMMEF